MYTFKDIGFRVIEIDDLGNLRKLHNDEDTFLNLLNIDLVDENSQIEWWKNLHKNKNDKRYVIVFSDSPEKVIGRLRIQNINTNHNNCEIGIDIIKEYRRKGIGTQLVKEMMQLNQNNSVKCINTDINCDAITKFLESLSIPAIGKQYEMIKEIL